MWPFTKNKTLPGFSHDEASVGFEAFQKGEDFLSKKQMQEALECFDEAINCGYVANADVYSGRGICLQSLNYDLDAIDDFNKAIALQPENSLTFYMRSLSKTATSDLHGCISDLQEAIRLLDVDNEYTRNVDAHARETGYKDAAYYYRKQMDFYRVRLDSEANRRAFADRMGEYYEKRANKRRRGSVNNAEE